MKQLSVCLIVKDEENLLPRCLESVQGLADEIIIVDTGSSDRTKQIAAQYTDLIYDFEWKNDFAAARNESLRHATSKWILVLDADEYLSIDEHRDWKAFLNNEKVASHLAYTLPVINFTGTKEYDDEITTSPVTRLFPNHKGIYFERPIHEQLTRGDNREIFHKKINLHIFHTGYQTNRVEEKNKHERNMAIFNQMKDSGQMSHYDWFTLGNQYRYAKEEEQALECYEKALAGSNTSLAWYSHCLIGLITLYYKQDKLAQSWDLTESKLSQYKEYAEYHTIKGIHYETLGFFEEAIASYLDAIAVGERRASQKQEIWLIDPMYSFESPVQQLIDIYFRLGDNQKAVYWLSKLLSRNNKNPKVLLRMLEWLVHNEPSDSVIQLLQHSYNMKDPLDRALVFKVAIALGHKDIVNHFSAGTKAKQYSAADKARLALMNQDHESWLQYTKESTLIQDESIQQNWVNLALGSLIWQDAGLLHQNSDLFNGRISLVELSSIVAEIVNFGGVKKQVSLEEYADELFLLAKNLFLLKQFDVFDQFMKKVSNPELINKLANYFYSLNLKDMAMNYYSILLSNNRLDLTSLQNLGYHHSNCGYIEETVEFMQAAILMEPKARHLYRTLIAHAKEDDKDQFIQLFYLHHPQYKSIPFLDNFFKQEIDLMRS